jgi:hypothetical protein
MLQPTYPEFPASDLRMEPKAVALRQSDLMIAIEDGKTISIEPEEGI